MEYHARKVVFLDIDGVVNTLQLDENLEPKYYTEHDGKVGNEQAIRWLNKLCKEEQAHIVISSTWKHGGIGVCRKCLYNSGLDPDIRIIDLTPTKWNKERGYEIKLWLKSHPEVEQFVILDDDSDMYPYMDRLVKCDSSKGFLGEEYLAAKAIFESQNPLLNDDLEG